MWVTEGPQTDPGAGTVLADTAPLLIRGWRPIPSLLVSANADALVILQHRNVDNDGNVRIHVFPIGANRPFTLLQPGSVRVLDGERFRVVTSGTTSGIIQASLMDDL